MKQNVKSKLIKVVLILLLVASLFPASFSIAEANSSKQLIIVNKAVNQMAFFDNGKLVKIFDVATGRTNDQTPEGTFRIVNKIIDRPYYTGNIPGGDPRNPLGNRWLGIETRGTYGTTYAIHGTINEASIGTYITSGCIRMYNDEIRWLFPLVQLYTPIHITSSKFSFDEIAYQLGYLNESQFKEINAELAGMRLDELRKTFEQATEKGDILEINKLYDGFTRQLRLTEEKIGQTPGAANRTRLNETYIRPAKIAVERTIYEVSQYRLINTINQLMDQRDFSRAKQRMAMLDRLKKRAVEIKQAGGYEHLPVQVDRALRQLEANAQGMILANETESYNAIIKSSNIDLINYHYDELTRQIRLTEGKIGQVFGPANRQNLNETFVSPAKKTIERVIYEVSQLRLMDQIEEIILIGNTEKAKSHLAKLDRLERRSIEIKIAGGYEALPLQVAEELIAKKNLIKASLIVVADEQTTPELENEK